MNLGLILIAVVVVLLAILGLAVAFGLISFGSNETGNMRALMASQQQGRTSEKKERASFGEIIKGNQAQAPRRVNSTLTLKKRLKYGRLALPVVAYHLLEVAISVLVMAIVNMKMNLLFTAISAVSGPMVMGAFLGYLVNKRFKRFDADYAQFLMSLVGLLKTGMTPLGAIEAAADGLEPNSLVRQECQLMIERLRFGVSEDKSIGAFGEDIYHPEIELFVQALLLSRRVGGVLSETLERLAKQVRKRQFFRNSAVGAVGMQRGSIWILIFMLAGIELYIYFMYPAIVVESIKNEIGWLVWQCGILVILIGIYWVRQVTKIRV